MPKVPRKHAAARGPLAKRQFVAGAGAAEQVEIGTAGEASATDVLKSMDEDARHILTKKGKQHMKREALMQRLEMTRSPYSKSHNRRLKRKEKEQLGGGLHDIRDAITALEDGGITTDAPTDVEAKTKKSALEQTKPSPILGPGQIGEGKGTPLNQSQRKRALQLERLRHPLILSHPDFASNPFQTIRIHAQNTLLKRQASP